MTRQETPAGREMGFTGRLGLKAENALQLADTIEQGLPYRAFERLQADMGVTHRELAGLVGNLGAHPGPAQDRGPAAAGGVRAAGAGVAHLRRRSNAVRGRQGGHAQLAALAGAGVVGTPADRVRPQRSRCREVEDLIGRLEQGVFG